MKESIEIIYNKILFALDLLATTRLPLQAPCVETEQYSRGGETIYRGYYCPSTVLDIIVGGANRGKLLNRFKKTPTYTYGFDGNGNLVAAKNNDTNVQEIITRAGDLEIGISFEPFDSDKISSISLAEYRSGKIHSYVHCNCDIYAQTINEVYGEVYEYQHDMLQRVFYCFPGWRVRSFTRENVAEWGKGLDPYLVKFTHDAEGYLKSYRYIEPPAYAGQICQVLLKRRA